MVLGLSALWHARRRCPAVSQSSSWAWAKKQNAAAWDISGKENPADAVGHFVEETREIYLTEDQMDRLLRALEDFPQQTVKDLEWSTKEKVHLAKEAERIAVAIRLMFLTGSRPGEVLHAKWTEFDLERQQWFRPLHRNKRKRSERMPLSGMRLHCSKLYRSKGSSCSLGAMQLNP